MLQARDYKNVPAPAVTMYSFGQPRVGNLPFSTDYGANALSVTPFLGSVTGHSALLQHWAINATE